MNIELNAGQKVSVKLLDLSGREVFSRDYNNSNEVFTRNVILGHLKKGVYLLYVKSGQRSGVKKLVIE